ncbi:Ig-like domain repeat protein [Nocardioides sp. LMS-CY]|uniref:Ig-like domain repeat protein n=1 Tax=Nocardioides sp. (strain LMS-CY) TaxID=2840457 RepID=UPI001C004D20|nr:Ig-like domain repeat protein [Nocardioides sp. LMS-CY]QWF24140.1 Ig-like domain repeat protein [Nocardioides sp. LMS-CY]
MRLRTLLATAVAGTLAVGLAGTAQADPVLAPAKAGKVVAWGTSADPLAGPALTVPGDLPGPVVSVAATNQATAVVTADGQMRAWGASDAGEVVEAPTDVTDAVSVALSGGHGAVLHADGKVTAWGPTPDLVDVPSDLRAKAISVAIGTGYAVRTDGTLAVWGTPPDFAPPSGLTDLVDVSAGLFSVMALRADGTIETWAHPFFAAFNDVPDFGGKKVTQIATGSTANGVVLEDGTIRVWGPAPPADLPDFAGKKVIGLDLYANAGAITEDGAVYSWGSVNELKNNIPADLPGQPLAAIAMGEKHAVVVVTEFREVSKPAVTGTPQVGQTLTAAPATFSLTPDAAATGQWYAGADPISGQTGTTLALDQALVGKTISYRSTATRGGKTITSASNQVGPVTAVAVVQPPLPEPKTKADSKVKAKVKVKGKSKKVAKKVTITVTVKTSDGVSPAGKVTVTLKGKTKKKVTAKVNAKGKAKVTVKKVKRGKYKAQLKYAGNADVAAAKTTKKFKV